MRQSLAPQLSLESAALAYRAALPCDDRIKEFAHVTAHPAYDPPHRPRPARR